jgi:hypothetical protein
MRRTLLAVGFAVLVSILFAPHKDHWNALDGVRWKYHQEAYETKSTVAKYRWVGGTMVNVPGHGTLGFPRGMTNEQIKDVLNKKFPPGSDDAPSAAQPLAPKTQNPFDDLIPVTVYHPAADIYYQPRWVDEWKWYPAFWPASSLLRTPFIAQTVFLSILAAVLANWRRRKQARP